MRLAIATLLLTLTLVTPVGARVLLRDDFDGPGLDVSRWTGPSGDASFFGRTQIRPAAAMPPLAGGVLRLQLDTYNPTALVPGDSFWGSEIDTIATYRVERGLVFEARARLASSLPAGLVGGFFAFQFDAATGTRDELDFEFLSNDLRAGRPRVLTNAFDDDDFTRPGDTSFVGLPGSGLDAFHVYQVRWLPDRVEWRIDGILVRTETDTIPDASMSIRLNLWAPDAGFAAAFDASLQPVGSAATNESFGYEIDWVEIRRPEVGSVLSFDGAEQLVNKNVGVERWAIIRHLADGTVTGNVFLADGSAPRFVWCRDISPSPGDASIALACWGADRCVAAPCTPAQWTFLGEVTLARAFFTPAEDVAWVSIAPTVILSRAFFAAPAVRTVDEAQTNTGVQRCRDGRCLLVNKDVSGERWSITRDLASLTVTGNVFVPDEPDPAFLWCQQTAAIGATITLACRIAMDAAGLSATPQRR